MFLSLKHGNRYVNTTHIRKLIAHPQGSVTLVMDDGTVEEYELSIDSLLEELECGKDS